MRWSVADQHHDILRLRSPRELSVRHAHGFIDHLGLVAAAVGRELPNAGTCFGGISGEVPTHELELVLLIAETDNGYSHAAGDGIDKAHQVIDSCLCRGDFGGHAGGAINGHGKVNRLLEEFIKGCCEANESRVVQLCNGILYHGHFGADERCRINAHGVAVAVKPGAPLPADAGIARAGDGGDPWTEGATVIAVEACDDGGKRVFPELREFAFAAALRFQCANQFNRQQSIGAFAGFRQDACAAVDAIGGYFPTASQHSANDPWILLAFGKARKRGRADACHGKDGAATNARIGIKCQCVEPLAHAGFFGPLEAHGGHQAANPCGVRRK